MQRVLPDQSGNFLQDLTCLFLIATEDRVHRDHVERSVFPQRPQRDARVLIDVAFPDLDEAAGLREA